MRFLPSFLALLLALLAAPAFADAPSASKFFDDARQQVADMRKQLASADVDDAQLDALRGQNNDLIAQAQALIADRAPKSAALDARAAELGPPPADGKSDAPDIAAQRRDIDRQRAALDADVKRAKLVLVDAGDIGNQITQVRRTSFQARLTRRTASPLTPAFWHDIGASLERDRNAAARLGGAVSDALTQSFAPANRAASIIGVVLGLFVLVVVRGFAERLLMHWTADRMPAGRLRRSALAFAIVVGTTLSSALGAGIALAALDWNGVFDDDTRAASAAVWRAIVGGSFVAALARALLSTARPSWRLPAIGNDVAQRLRLLPWLLGAAIGFGILVNRFYALAGTSLSATILGSLAVALVYALLIGWGLARAARTPAAAEKTQRPAWISAAIALLWLGVLATLFAALAGYVALAHQIARQMISAGIITATLYLLVHFIEDVFAGAVSSRAGWMQRTLGLSRQALDQWSVLASGALRVTAIALGLLAMLKPLGADPAELAAQAGQFGGSLSIGQISITPLAIVTAALVLFIGMAAVRGAQRWLLDSFLPTTRLDEPMRNSITTLLGWIGIVVVIALTLAALGLSLERIAWVASALSVGIGFGLQAIVQNFVSGLILLVERPVKVGDWVVLGDIEGDIRRINVRATEIQLGDRSTAIVPNSELITKSVRNVTLANAEGRVRFTLPLPLDSDAERVRAIVLAALKAHPGVLDRPAPSVLLDGIASGALVFVAAAYIASPRQAGGVRSDILIEVLAQLRAEGIALSAPMQVSLGADAAVAPPVAS